MAKRAKNPRKELVKSDRLAEREWMKEIERRIDDFEAGRVTAIPIKEALERLGRNRKRLGSKRRDTPK